MIDLLTVGEATRRNGYATERRRVDRGRVLHWRRLRYDELVYRASIAGRSAISDSHRRRRSLGARIAGRGRRRPCRGAEALSHPPDGTAKQCME